MGNNKERHAYWIHEKIDNPNSINGFFYARECKCSNCGYQVNMEKEVCPNCGAMMDEKPSKEEKFVPFVK